MFLPKCSFQTRTGFNGKKKCPKPFFQGLFVYCKLWKDEPVPVTRLKGPCLRLWPRALPVPELGRDSVNRYKVMSVDCSHITSKLEGTPQKEKRQASHKAPEL